MTTIVNNPAPAQDSTNGMGLILGLILLFIFALVFLSYGVPALRSTMSPQINVPGKVDVNVSTPNSK